MKRGAFRVILSIFFGVVKDKENTTRKFVMILIEYIQTPIFKLLLSSLF